jgi:cell division protein FtsB
MIEPRREISIPDLLVKIGMQVVEIDSLRAQVTQLSKENDRLIAEVERLHEHDAFPEKADD